LPLRSSSFLCGSTMRLRNKIFLGIALFLVSYPVFLVLWIQIKPYYGYALTGVGARLAAVTTGLELENVRHGEEKAEVSFTDLVMTGEGLGEIFLDLKIAVSDYSFNVPLTFALVAGLFPFFRWRKMTLVEACLILILIHLSYIYFFCILQLFHKLTLAGIRTTSRPVQFFLQFMWTFTDNMVIRFEPFLVAVYLWLRNRTEDLMFLPSERAARDNPKGSGKQARS